MLQVNASRLLQNLESLGRIGRTADSGISRPALSGADAQARTWFQQRTEGAGLRFQMDGAGNLSAVLPALDPEADTLLAGSHLDTVPNGGRYDGALGVLCALEALQSVKEAGLQLPYHLEAIAFTDEEGSVVSMLGSRAVTGRLERRDLDQARDAEQLAAGLDRLGLTEAGILSARRDLSRIAGFVEVHIEQGARLEEQGLQIGIVTSIVGIRSYWLTFEGRAGHAGATPMDQRADALRGAADFVLQAGQLVMSRYSPGVMNCGQLHLSPGAFNIIPAQVRLALEFRHGTEAQLDQMEADLLALASQLALKHGLTLSSEAVDGCQAAAMDERMVRAVESAAANLGLRHTRLLSLAGHDAQNLSPFTPTALFFVPSMGGVSHHPAEFTRNEDVVNGANVLLHTLLQLIQI